MTTPFTTLKRLHGSCQCTPIVIAFLNKAGNVSCGDEPITYKEIIETVGLKKALPSFLVEPKYRKLWKAIAHTAQLRGVKHRLVNGIASAPFVSLAEKMPANVAAMTAITEYMTLVTNAELGPYMIGSAKWVAANKLNWDKFQTVVLELIDFLN